MWGQSESELLLTTAELSVAFAGFASLASVLGRRFSRDDLEVDAGRLLNMLTVSLSVTGLALVPFIPMLLAWSPRWVWGSAGGLGVAAMAVVVPIVMRRIREMKPYAGYNRGALAANNVLGVVAFLGLTCSLLGVPTEAQFAAYFTSLLALLGVSGVLFYRVIASLLQPNGPGPDHK